MSKFSPLPNALDIQHALDEIQKSNLLSDIEFSYALLDKVLEISQAIARSHEGTKRLLNEAGLISLAKDIAGVIENSNPYFQDRRDTKSHQDPTEIRTKTDQTADFKISPLKFSRGDDSALHYSHGEFTTKLTPTSENKFTISINGLHVGETETLAKAALFAQAQHDGQLFRSSIGKLALLPFDCSDVEDPEVLATSETPVGTYEIRREADEISLYLANTKISTNQNVADTVTRATEHYASKVMSI